MSDDTLEPFISADRISVRVAELGREISADATSGGELIVIGLLKGSFIFIADLVRNISVPQRVEFVRASSYGDRTTSSGQVIMSVGTPFNLRGRNVLIVEDVLDTGLTMTRTLATVRAQQPARVKTVALLAKSTAPVEAREAINYVGFEIGTEYVVGYGLDHAEKHRELADLWVLRPSAR